MPVYTNQRWVTSQKGERLIYTAAKAWNNATVTMLNILPDFT